LARRLPVVVRSMGLYVTRLRSFGYVEIAEGYLLAVVDALQGGILWAYGLRQSDRQQTRLKAACGKSAPRPNIPVERRPTAQALFSFAAPSLWAAAHWKR
jgi:hypothetical protein